jgi:hypothetical protein
MEQLYEQLTSCLESPPPPPAMRSSVNHYATPQRVEVGSLDATPRSIERQTTPRQGDSKYGYGPVTLSQHTRRFGWPMNGKPAQVLILSPTKTMRRFEVVSTDCEEKFLAMDFISTGFEFGQTSIILTGKSYYGGQVQGTFRIAADWSVLKPLYKLRRVPTRQDGGGDFTNSFPFPYLQGHGRYPRVDNWQTATQQVRDYAPVVKGGQSPRENRPVPLNEGGQYLQACGRQCAVGRGIEADNLRGGQSPHGSGRQYQSCCTRLRASHQVQHESWSHRNHSKEQDIQGRLKVDMNLALAGALLEECDPYFDMSGTSKQKPVWHAIRAKMEYSRLKTALPSALKQLGLEVDNKSKLTKIEAAELIFKCHVDPGSCVDHTRVKKVRL